MYIFFSVLVGCFAFCGVVGVMEVVGIYKRGCGGGVTRKRENGRGKENQIKFLFYGHGWQKGK